MPPAHSKAGPPSSSYSPLSKPISTAPRPPPYCLAEPDPHSPPPSFSHKLSHDRYPLFTSQHARERLRFPIWLYPSSSRFHLSVRGSDPESVAWPGHPAKNRLFKARTVYTPHLRFPTFISGAGLDPCGYGPRRKAGKAERILCLSTMNSLVIKRLL